MLRLRLDPSYSTRLMGFFEFSLERFPAGLSRLRTQHSKPIYHIRAAKETPLAALVIVDVMVWGCTCLQMTRVSENAKLQQRPSLEIRLKNPRAPSAVFLNGTPNHLLFSPLCTIARPLR